MSQNPLSKFLKQWTKRVRRASASAAPRSVRLQLEEVERREVPAAVTTLPEVTVAESRRLEPTGGSFIDDGFGAQLAVDPTNPNRMIAVAAGQARNRDGWLYGFVNGMFSRDGGLNWESFSNTADNVAQLFDPDFGALDNFEDPFLQNRSFVTDPLLVNVPARDGVIESTVFNWNYEYASSPSITFARDGTVHVAFLMHNLAKTSGVLMVSTFDFSGDEPELARVNQSLPLNPVTNPMIAPEVVYRWVNQDPALNPYIAVDTTTNDYDPTTPADVTDPNTLDDYADPAVPTTTTSPSSMSDKPNPIATNPDYRASPVYVVWNTNATLASASGGIVSTNPNAIFMAASGDRGIAFSTPVIVNTNGYGGGNGNRGVHPQIIFTPGEVNPDTDAPAGRMQIVWSAPDLAGNLTTIRVDSTRPDGGDWVFQVADSSGDLSFNPNVGIVDAVVPPPPPTPPPGAPPLPPVPPTPDILGVTNIVLPVNLLAAGSTLMGPDLITDLDFGLSLTHNDLSQLRIILVSPSGEWVNLARNRLNGYGNQIQIPNPNRGLPAGTGLGILPNPRPPGSPNGALVPATFSDEAPRRITDNNNIAPFTATFRPESLPFSTFVPVGEGPGPNGASPPFTPPPGFVPSGPQANDLRDLYTDTAGNPLTADSPELNGNWRLVIYDFVANNSPAGSIVRYANFKFASQIENSPTGGFGNGPAPSEFGDPDDWESTRTGGTVPSAPDQTFPTANGNPIDPNGIGPSVSVAYDRSLGAFSPYSGRIYMIYTGGGGTNTNVLTRFSNDNGDTWSAPVQVNNDSAADHFTEGNRAQHMPTITVDPLTGTVVAMWYDARFDASNARSAQYMSTSTDGGLTWSEQTYIGLRKTAADAIDINAGLIDLEPIPSNQQQTAALGFGTRQGLVAYGGKVTAVWSGNENTTLANATPQTNTTGSEMFTATIHTAAGPRVVSSDIGTVNTPVTLSGTAPSGRPYVDPVSKVEATFTYNNTFAADGTRLIDGFVVQFDRDVDVSTFTANDIRVLFRGPNTPLTDPGSSIPTRDPVPLDAVRGHPDPSFTGPDDATTFFVRFVTPQTAVGTYSYAVSPNVRDRIRRIDGISQVPANDAAGNPLPAPFGSPYTVSYLPAPPPPPGVVVPIPFTTNPTIDYRVPVPGQTPNGLPVPDIGIAGNDPAIAPNVMPSFIPLNIPAFPIDPNTNLLADVAQVIVTIPSLTHPRLSDLQIELRSPQGVTVVLAPTGSLTGSDMVNTRFIDGGTPLALGTASYTGDFQPANPLSAFAGAQNPIGTWSLIVRDSVSGQVGVLRDFGLIVIPVTSDPPIENSLDLIAPGRDYNIPGEGTTTSSINVSGANLPPGTVVGDVVLDLNIEHPFVGDLRIELQHANPGSGVTTVVRLTDANWDYDNGFKIGNSGDNLTNTRFDDNALREFGDVLPEDAPFSGAFRGLTGTGPLPGDPPTIVRPPIGTLPLSAFRGMDPTGDWTLVITDTEGNDVGRLLNWSLTIMPGKANTLANQSAGNYIDQNANSRTLELPTSFPGSSDVYSVPLPEAGVPFQGPYQENTLPLAVTGPFILRTSVVGQESRLVSVVQTVGQRILTVTFDRPVDPTTFTPAQITRISGPSGDISGPFTVTPEYPGATSAVVPGTPTRTYRINLPNTAPPNTAGTYTVVVNSSIEAADDLALNTGATALKVTFNRDMDITSFTTADIVSLVGPNGPIAGPYTITPINPINGGARQFIVGFTPQSATGTYYAIIGADIQSVNQSQLTTTLAVGTTSIDLTFDRDVAAEIAAGRLSPLDSLRVFGPGGLVTGTFTLTAVPGGPPRTYRLTFPAAVTTPGQYMFDFTNQVTNLPVLGSELTLSFTSPVLLTTADILAVRGPRGLALLNAVFPNGTTAGITVTPVAPDGTGKSVTWRLTLPDQIPSTSQVDQLVAGLYAVSFTNPYRVALGSVTATIGAPSNTLDITLPQPTPSLALSDVYTVTGPGGQALGPTSVAPVPGDTTGTRWRLSFPDQNPGTPTLDPLPAGTYTVVFTTGAELDNNTNAGLDRLLGGDARTGTIRTIRNATASAPITITAGGTTSMSVVVPQDVLIQQNPTRFPDKRIELVLNISHPRVQDLDLTLVAPDGTRVRLYTGSQLRTPDPTFSANFTNTRLADDTGVGTPILSAQPPFDSQASGLVFLPQFPLSVLVGMRSLGTWRLEVTNNGTVSTGTIDNFSLELPFVETGTGLGETYADRYTAGFRTFNQDSTQPSTQQLWTPVGANPTNPGVQGNTGRATAVSVDSSDPSGNTVFVGGASGGVWKTTNFLTTNPAGPTWVPLLDYSFSAALNIGSIAVFPRNGDPSQTIVYALTGEGGGVGVGDIPSTPSPSGTAGVGVLRSFDGGRTWEVLDSRNNLDGTGAVARFNSPTRDHVFSGATGFKIVADPTLSPQGEVILYMAVSETNATPAALVGQQGGIWRSRDGGDTWQRLLAGQGTDLTLSSSGIDASGNIRHLFAAIRGANSGVYFTDQAPGTSTLTLTATAPLGNGNIQDAITQTPVDVANGGSPNGINGRITLAVPALTDNPLKNSFYQGWVYATVANPDGSFNGLYVTKDFGRNWTRIRIPTFEAGGVGSPLSIAFGTNNDAPGQRNDVDVFDKDEPPPIPGFPVGAPTPSVGNQNMSLVVDPQNPNIVYMGGLGAGNDASQPLNGMIRVDTTIVNTSQTLVYQDNSAGNVGAQVQAASTGGVTGDGGLLEVLVSGLPGLQFYTNRRSDLLVEATDFINLFRDPNNPFSSESTLFITGGGTFTNNGQNATLRPFSEFIQTGRFLSPNTGKPLIPVVNPTTRQVVAYRDPDTNLIEPNPVPEPLATGINELFSFVDPVTGLTRLIATADQGIYTGVDLGDGTMASSIGTLPVVNRGRNGNLQLGQYYSGAVQPSQGAADIAGALFYAMSRDNGFPVSSGDLLPSGNTSYTGELFDPFVIDPSRAIAAPELRPGSGTQVVVDQTGTGASLQYRQPAAIGNAAALSDFLRYFSPTADPSGSGQGITTGLIRGNGVDLVINNVGQWPLRNDNMGYSLSVNPINTVRDPNPANRVFGILIGSEEGRVYRNTNAISGATGANFFEIGPAALVNAGGANMIRATAFGAPSIGEDSSQINNYVYVGTISGQVWVTANAGAGTNGPWRNITGTGATGIGAGEEIRQLIPNSRRGTPNPTRDLFAVTDRGVYYMADSTAATPTWVNITGNLFTLTNGIFDSTDPLDQAPILRELNTIAADWRYTLPVGAGGQVRPQLYAGGEGGVFRLSSWTDPTNGATAVWEYFPRASTYTDQFGNNVNVAAGGLLPDTNVTDLDISTGAINPATGLPNSQNDSLNVLVATTFGRGQWTIRLNTNDLPPSTFVSGPAVTNVTVPTPTPGIASGRIVLDFNGPVDPATFTEADVRLVGPGGSVLPITGVTLISPTAADGSNPRNQYEVTFAPPPAVADYTLTIGYNPGGVGHFQAVNVPEIAGVGGQLMNQNGNLVNGEPGAAPTGDQFVTTVRLVPIPQPVASIVLATTSAGPFGVGVPITFTVTALDANGNATVASGPVSVNPGVAGATVDPVSPQFVNGVATFTITYPTAGTFTVTATGAGFSDTEQVTTIVVGPPANVSVTPATAGPFRTGQVVTFNVRVLDSAGVLTGFNGPMTVGLTPTDAAAVIVASVPIANGVGSFTVTFGTAGTYTVSTTITPPGGPITGTTQVSVEAPSVQLSGTSVVGSDVGGSPVVNIVNPNGTIRTSFIPFPAGAYGQVDPFGPGFTGGIRTAVGDVNGDDVDDYIVGNGPTISSHVLVINGANGQTLLDYQPFEPSFLGGVFVAAGDVTGDGLADIVITPDVSGGPRVIVLRGGDFQRIGNFFAFSDDPNFRGGARAAVGDVNADGFGDLVVSAGFGGGPRIGVFDGKNLTQNGRVTRLLGDFFMFEPTLRNGAYVAVGDINGDGFADIIGGGGPGGGPRVLALDGQDLVTFKSVLRADVLANFFAGNIDNRGGVRVAAKDLDGDDFADLVVGDGEGAGSQVTAYNGSTVGSNPTVLWSFDAYPGINAGVFVG